MTLFVIFGIVVAAVFLFLPHRMQRLAIHFQERYPALQRVDPWWQWRRSTGFVKSLRWTGVFFLIVVMVIAASQ